MQLLGMGLTQAQVAAFFEIGVTTLQKSVTTEERESARAKMGAQLLNTAYKQAMDGSERMLIFLLKTQLQMAEGAADMRLKVEAEKELLDYKRKIGYTEIAAAPIEIYLNEPAQHTPAYDRNVIESDHQAHYAPGLAESTSEGSD